MDDNTIVEMYFQRNEAALRETQTKYGRYLFGVAYNILANNEDCSECLNDTYLNAWNSIPPTRPLRLGCYLAAVMRNIAISRFRREHTKSRAGSQYAVSLDELEECVSGGVLPDRVVDSQLIGKCISDWLRILSSEVRIIFVCRYFYCDSVHDIASRMGLNENTVKSTLMRARQGLKAYLIKEGFDV
ncbi:MAG: sigma-70 family RNA polymerase sigma factor [Ruminiclostridium sp.]|nr:sigma-70 family RNA polymerase sigma factor [Ruminiclostridium sp.]